MKRAELVSRHVALIFLSLLTITTIGINPSFAQALDAPLTPPKDSIQSVIDRSEFSFRKAQEAYNKGQKDEARRLFDESVDVIMLSGYNLRANPKLDAYYAELVERIAGYELPMRAARPTPPVQNPASNQLAQPSVAVQTIGLQDNQTKTNVEKSVIDE